MMRRRGVLTAAAGAIVIATACTAGGSDTATTVPNSNPSASHAPVTLTVWSAFVAPELPKFEAVLAHIHEMYPWITIKSVGGKQPTDIQRAVNSNTAPDVALEPSPDDSAAYCSTGTWIDLNPFIKADGIDLAATSPPAALRYTSYQGTQCSLPMLSDAYGLYYNVDMLNAAGITSPPRTLSEFKADALKLTTYNPDGSIKVLGYNPLPSAWENPALTAGPYSGAQWYDASGKSALASDPRWETFLAWQKSLVDAIGYKKLTAWFASVGGADSEFSPSNAWENHKVAMTIDGEWRVTFVNDDKAAITYATAPFPVADDNASAYGGGTIGGTILGIPKGTPHTGDAWLVVKYLALDTGAEVALAHSLGNVPTTYDSLKDPTLATDPHFKTFLDLFGNPNSGYKQITPIGTADADLLSAYQSKYVAGNGGDLHAGLQGVADQIDKQGQLG